MEILNSVDIKGLSITIQCTFANAYTEPEANRGLCIRSFDRKELARKGDTSGGIIGTLTGNYTTDENDVVWLEANLKYTDRRKIGWFRERDIYFSKKVIVTPDTPDGPVVPAVINPQDNPTPEKNSFNWLAWVTGGVTVLKLITG